MVEENKVEVPKATPEVSVDKPKSEPSVSDLELKGAEKAKDVSDDELKAAYRVLDSYVEASDSSDEKVEVAKEAEIVESPKAEKSEDDLLDAAILDDLKKEESEKKPSLVDKEDRPDINKIRELERKLEEKEKQLGELAITLENKNGSVNYPPEFFEKVAEKYGVDVDQAKAFILMNEDAFATSVKPMLRDVQKAIDAMKGEKVLSQAKDSIQKDKLYEILKDEMKSVMETDEDIKDIPDSPGKYRLALAKAKENKLDLIVKAAKNRAKKQAMDNVKIIPSGEEGVAKEVKKSNSISLSKEDLYYAKKLGYKKEDLENMGKTPTSFTES